MTEDSTKLPVQKSAETEKTEPLGPLDRLHREIDRVFNDIRLFDWRLPPRVFGREVPHIPRGDWHLAPAIDLAEKDDVYEITAELPGLDEKNVEIKLDNNTLTISGEKAEEKEDKRKDYYLSERRYGAFRRSFQLPEGIDRDRVEASFSRGVLTVRLPKTAEARQGEKTIPIRAA